MTSYKLIDVIKRKSKEGKEYNIAVVLLKDTYGYNLVNVMVQDKQVQPLLDTLKNPSFDLNKYVGVSFNGFTKAFQLTISYAL